MPYLKRRKQIKDMPYPPPHDATSSELAHEAWAGPMELELLPANETKFLRIDGGEGTGSVLCMSHNLVVKITRALCIGRTYRTRRVQTQKDEETLGSRLVDKRATLETLEIRRGRSQKRIEEAETLDHEHVQHLEDLYKRIHRCRHDEQAFEEDLRDLKKHQQEDLETWKVAWLSVEKNYWTRCGQMRTCCTTTNLTRMTMIMTMTMTTTMTIRMETRLQYRIQVMILLREMINLKREGILTIPIEVTATLNSATKAPVRQANQQLNPRFKRTEEESISWRITVIYRQEQ